MKREHATVRLASSLPLAVLCACILIFAGRPAVASDPVSSVTAGPLDGRTFSARIVREGGSTDGPLEDSLTFSRGRFSSAVCKRYNFEAAPYWIRQEEGSIRFLAELTSPTDGKMLWEGAVVDDRLVGTMRWTKERWYWTLETEHEIEGELTDAAPPSVDASAD